MLGSAAGMDKDVMKSLFIAASIPIVKHLTILRSAIPGVASVTNPEPAYGGVDPESLDSARQRAAMEIRSRYRAVTAEDYEFLVGEASSRVGRSICLPPATPADPIRVHVLPRVAPADRQLTFAELTPDEEKGKVKLELYSVPELKERAALPDAPRAVGVRVDRPLDLVMPNALHRLEPAGE